MKLLFLLFFLCFQALYGEIHVIYTSALISKNFEERKSEYLTNLDRLRSYGLDPWIIEATNVSHSFFDAVSNRVLYPQVHNDAYRNKACNELLSMRAVIEDLPFQDDDIVIKVTGRYLLYKPKFIELIARNPTYDVYVKHWPRSEKYVWYHNTKIFIFTGCFAMKWKLFKEMLYSFDVEEMEQQPILMEQAVATFINQHALNVLPVKQLYMLAKIVGFHNELWKL